MNKRNKQQGFTLVEILVTVAILGFLAVVILTALDGSRRKARDTQRRQSLLNLQKALENYYTANGSYPCTGGPAGVTCVSPYTWRGLIPNCPAAGVTNTGVSGYIPNLAPTYVSVLPSDPKPGTTGCAGYMYRSDGTNYKLVSIRTITGGGPEITVTANDPLFGQLYDYCRPGYAYMVTDRPSVTNPTSGVCGSW